MSWSSPSRRRKPSAERTRRLRRDESKLGLASCIQKSECVPQPVTMWLRVASRLSKCPSEQRLGVYANASSSSGLAHALDPPNPAVPKEPGPPRGHHSVGKRKPSPRAFSTPITSPCPATARGVLDSSLPQTIIGPRRPARSSRRISGPVLVHCQCH
jgi:hypothetical protein